MSYESHKETRHFLDTPIDRLDHTATAHLRWHMPTITRFLPCLETAQDNSFTMGETVLNIWQKIPRIGP